MDRAAKRLNLENGSTLSYGKLVLATGTYARRLPLAGADKQGVVTLRSIADVDAIRESLKACNRLAIIGAGYIGLEVAAVARALGKEVSVIEAQDRVMKRVVSETVSSFFSQRCTCPTASICVSTPASSASRARAPSAV
ncbi:FAD-dependent oxidoreductase [Roseibium salinum]|nr:FAD-dependent oxidoreductase [Roseibium salinum]